MKWNMTKKKGSETEKELNIRYNGDAMLKESWLDRWSSKEDTVKAALIWVDDSEKPVWYADINYETHDNYAFDLYFNVGRWFRESTPYIPDEFKDMWEFIINNLSDYSFIDDQLDDGIDFAVNDVYYGSNNRSSGDPESEAYAEAKLNIEGGSQAEADIKEMLNVEFSYILDVMSEWKGFPEVSADELDSIKNQLFDILWNVYTKNGYQKELLDLDGKRWEESF